MSRCLAFLAMSACSHYHVVGATRPFGMQRVAIVPFAEDVPIGTAADIVQSLAEELAQSGLELTTDTKRADGVLRGTVVAANAGPNLSSIGGIASYTLSLSVRAELLDRNATSIWSTQVSVAEDFPYAGKSAFPALGTEANRRMSATRLGREAARAIHLRLMLASDAGT